MSRNRSQSLELSSQVEKKYRSNIPGIQVSSEGLTHEKSLRAVNRGVLAGKETREIKET